MRKRKRDNVKLHRQKVEMFQGTGVDKASVPLRPKTKYEENSAEEKKVAQNFLES